ncbi:MAG: cryptochrome/photolyase family protein [Opitutales bacterium]
MRNLVVVLGDQLNRDSTAWQGFDPQQDAAWMAEVVEEATHVPSIKMRTALFFAAMRHFRDELRKDDIPLHYTELTPKTKASSLQGELGEFLEKHKPERVLITHPGDHRVRENLRQAVADADVVWEERPDEHFLCPLDDFNAHADGRKSLRMEFFYREMRERYGVLLDKKGKPEGGSWNYDVENRETFGKEGPGFLTSHGKHKLDEVTKEVIALVNERFSDAYGTLAEKDFNWPVTRRQALAHLKKFVEERLPDFGTFQDAMWTGEPFLYHSTLSNSLNLKLLNPREVIEAAEQAYRNKQAPLPAVEGFIRQILGWREFIRGVYWRFMPEYVERNHLDAHEPLPELYWTGETEMRCLAESIGPTLRYGYSHHIQRLMVQGLFAMLYGVHPKQIHAWFLAVHVDAVEQLELVNVAGMSQFADGGLMASKPYAATGKYINRMSNYCKHCRFKPDKADGDNACPFSTLYWDFLRRNRQKLEPIVRMKMQLKNLDRKKPEQWRAIDERLKTLRTQLP